MGGGRAGEDTDQWPRLLPDTEHFPPHQARDLLINALHYVIHTITVLLLSTLGDPVETPIKAEEIPFLSELETKYSWVNEDESPAP